MGLIKVLGNKNNRDLIKAANLKRVERFQRVTKKYFWVFSEFFYINVKNMLLNFR